MNSAFENLFQLGTADDRQNHEFTCAIKETQDEGELSKKTVDYIFVNKNEWYKSNQVVVTEFMDPMDLERQGSLSNEYPSENHPSDHFSLVYNVALEPRA